MRTPGALAQLIPWLLLVVVFYLGCLYGGRKERRRNARSAERS